MTIKNVSSRAFTAMQNLNITELVKCSPQEIRPLLSSLVRMTLLTPMNNVKHVIDTRKKILSALVNIEAVNSIVSFLQVDYHELEIDVRKEQQLR